MISLENLFSCAPTGLENPRQKWELAVYVINNHALLKNQVLWEAQGFPFKKIFRGHCDPQVVDFGGHFQFERVTYWSLWCLTRVEFLKFVQPEPAENGLFCQVFTHGWHFILPFSKYNQSYFTSQSSQNPLGLDVFLGVLGPGCDSSSLSLFRFSVADEKNDNNFDCDIFVDWFIVYQ